MMEPVETLELNVQLQNMLNRVKVPPSLLIAFSGIDGSGKTTQLCYFNKWLQGFGLQTWITKVDQHGFAVIRKLAEKLVGDPYAYYLALPATLHQFVLACDCAAHYFTSVLPVLRTGRVVLCDRWSLCYQVCAQGLGADLNWVMQVLALVPPPDITFLLDITVDAARERIVKRSSVPLRTDENPELLTRAREIYLTLAAQKEHISVIDASLSPEAVQYAIRQRFVEHFAKRV